MQHFAKETLWLIFVRLLLLYYKIYYNVTFTFKVCGQNKKKPKLDEKWKEIIEQTQVEASEEFTQCTNVIISDRFALTAAACIEK